VGSQVLRDSAVWETKLEYTSGISFDL